MRERSGLSSAVATNHKTPCQRGTAGGPDLCPGDHQAASWVNGRRVFGGESGVNDLTGALVRLGARKLMQERLEAEVGEFLGRDR